ncbi:MAG: imidazole glycerol phosphate synthase subunit HisH [Acidimicrobiales bacterium]|jgi:glutamine amidotransferase|nr:imidazole glycerol phosphate synthase subunit HisH [Acidimicrobiales bacterium]
MPRVALIDYGLCNLDSARRAIEENGGQPYVVTSGDRLGRPDHIVLPGVGAFPDAMANLRDRGLVEPLRDEVLVAGVPLLGICLGMQLLATSGDEAGGAQGLGWIPGTVVRLQARNGERVPHMGWNEIEPVAGATLLEGIASGTDVYFVHSFHLVPDDPTHIAARTPYCGGFVSAVHDGPVFGVQFHPEKSQKTGFRVLANFLAM